MNSQKIDIKSLQYDALQELVKDLGQPKYRAGQIFSWLHEKGVRSFEEMTNLPESLRKELSEKCDIVNITKKKVLTSSIDGTKKYLFELQDGHLIESVMMRYKHGNSVCVSSQVGCAMGCAFCATGRQRLRRNLAAGEMLWQLALVERDFGCSEGLISNTMRNNPYMRLAVDKWEQQGAKQRVLRLVDEYKKAVSARLKQPILTE